MQKKENWGTPFGAILAVTGSAVGLGNYLRFPGQAALYGGGAFMIPYITAFFLLGLPIAWAEWTIGRYAGIRGYNSAPGIFRCITGSRKMAYAGSICVSLTTLIFAYYVLVEGWCLLYAFRYLCGRMSAADTTQTFAAVSGVQTDGALFQNGLLNPTLLCMLVCFVFNFFLIYRGVVKGIEKFCFIAMPALLICSVIILIRVLTLGNPTGTEGQSVLNGLGYMWNPSQPGKTLIQTLSNPQAWIAAAGQIFFSLSLGMGCICTYASYSKRNDDIALSSLTAAVGNEFCEVVLAGLTIVPAAVIFLGASFFQENLNSSFSIGFNALPNVFALMPFGQFFGFLFFFLLFLAATTSSISMLQPGIALLEEGLKLSRKSSTAVMGVITFAGAVFTAYFTHNLTALDTLDFWCANILIFLMAGVQIVVFGWILGIGKGMEELERGAQIKIPAFYRFVMKYITPLYLIIVFLAWAYLKLPDYFGIIAGNAVVQMSLAYIAFVMIFNFFVTSQSLVRWEKDEKLEHGQNVADGEL
ncbi:MAG: sodium-dependent transporter [Planctomycetaceae bacterium]|jgi:SNF family Na+-dependent transporter|nr:sodium-dependent transporter [Planctomycetaceae bacterium]